MDISSFDQWINTLSEAINKAHAAGLSDDKISKSAMQLGNFLAANVTPDIPENKLLKELWDTGDEKEKEILAEMVVKMVKNKNIH